MARKPITYGNFTEPFLNSLAEQLKGKRVLEIFAGNGFLASELEKRGITILPTTIFSGHDGHAEKMYTDVLEIDALSAVKEYTDDHDILLVCWPTTTEETWKASMEWGSEKPIFFIGEAPKPGNPYPGCASDTFFEAVEQTNTIPGYEPRNYLDSAYIMHSKPEWIKKYREGHRPIYDFGI